ncbi:aminodeoxychorismate lyase [Tsukamurella sp. 8F]|uniref:aminodeoxychorismate lyase n=1 Tax=unclassified Tsukamurella TaxID=2633480 RepID=UPI0023B95EB1|nr:MULTISPECIES: aminodeoxychorismate lyase [unclassified Tsukamurella]MDF0528419.1 aminodeoxychorismate lyase [Tsukamurella sp. 8J]MDF0586244.1 aminodeoxychorismate lyase [Tsukamurella sp. 8F]
MASDASGGAAPSAGAVSGGGPAVVVTLDGATHDPARPLLFADDLAAVRGDGCFETVLVRGGRPLKPRAHLDRLARSAAALGLPKPNDSAWWAAMERAAVLFGERAGEDAEGALRLVYSRGRESDPTGTSYVTVAPLGARVRTAREDGVAALTLPRGYSVDLAQTAPWLLLGAKTLSYAVNMAALRYAESRGAGDVIFTSSEGRVLEGPRSTVLVARGRTLVTPPDDQGILPGTTVAAVLDAAEDKGVSTEVAPLFPADLVTADGVWLVSSITLCARVHTLDGHALPDAPMDADVRALIEHAITTAP